MPHATATVPAVHRVISMAHVADVGRSIAFYGVLGLACESVHRDPQGTPFWAMLSATEPDGTSRSALMLTRADGPISPEVQAVLFYMFAADVAALRDRALAAGVPDGGAFHGPSAPARHAVFTPATPWYMPSGELRLHDPDGYVILVGQEDPIKHASAPN